MRRWKHLVLAAALVATPALVAQADQEKSDKGKGDASGQAADDAKGRLAAVDRRIQDEIDKHARRTARIDRVAELARGKKDDKATADAAHLREVEGERHKRAMEKLSSEREAAASGKPGGESDKSAKKDEHGKSDKAKAAPPEGKGPPENKEHPEGMGPGTDVPADKGEGAKPEEGKKPEEAKDGEKPKDDKEKEKEEKDKGKSEEHGKGNK